MKEFSTNNPCKWGWFCIGSVRVVIFTSRRLCIKINVIYVFIDVFNSGFMYHMTSYYHRKRPCDMVETSVCLKFSFWVINSSIYYLIRGISRAKYTKDHHLFAFMYPETVTWWWKGRPAVHYVLTMFFDV